MRNTVIVIAAIILVFALSSLLPDKSYKDKYEPAPHSDRIEVGDEVIWSDGSAIIVTMVYVDGGSEWCDGVNQNGRAYHVLLENVHKTGRHFIIGSILKEINDEP